jgi:psp operon transcriptional activator
MGTLFLDEIGSIPIEVQEKILRVVEYRTFEQVGSSIPLQADVRIIGATNADLPTMAEQGRFKRDLLDRLSFEVLFLPPLRKRGEDILLLANHFAARMAFEMERQEVPEFSEDAMAALEGYLWPGNIRELKNVVERAVYQSDSSIISTIVFDPFFHDLKEESLGEIKEPDDSGYSGSQHFPEVNRDKSFTAAVREVELQLIKQALKETRFNQRKAARLLGLSYHQFRGLYRKYRIHL